MKVNKTAERIQNLWAGHLLFTAVLLLMYRNQYVFGWIGATVVLLGGQYLIGRKGKAMKNE